MTKAVGCALVVGQIATSAMAFVLSGGSRIVTQSSTPHPVTSMGRGIRPAAPLYMAIKAVESYNADFELEEKTAATLDAYLKHPDMIKEVCKQFDCKDAKFVGEIFQPVPYSAATPRGMPAEIEEKYYLNEQYGITNIPPVVMFNAKIFKPSRLCAVFRIDGMSDAAREAFEERVRRVRDNIKRKKEESELENEWDDIGSAFTEVYNIDLDDDDVNLDDMVV